MRPMGTPYVEVSAVSDNAFILDVREPDEWQVGHVEGSLHIPMGQIPQRAEEVPRDRRVVVVCHGGAINAYLGHVAGIDRPLWFEPAYASISRVAASRDGVRSIVSINETGHLRYLAVPG